MFRAAAGANAREAWGWTARRNGPHSGNSRDCCQGTGHRERGDLATRVSQSGVRGFFFRRGGAGLVAGGQVPSGSMHTAHYLKTPRVTCDVTVRVLRRPRSKPGAFEVLTALRPEHGPKPGHCAPQPGGFPESPMPLVQPPLAFCAQAPPVPLRPRPPSPAPCPPSACMAVGRLLVPLTQICSPGPRTPAAGLGRPLLGHQSLGCCDSY